MAQHHTIFLPSDQSRTTARKIREAVNTSFQTPPRAPCRNCCVCSYFTTRRSPAFTPCPSRARTCTQPCLCTAREPCEIQEAGCGVQISSTFAREMPRLDFKVLHPQILSRASRCYHVWDKTLCIIAAFSLGSASPLPPSHRFGASPRRAAVRKRRP